MKKYLRFKLDIKKRFSLLKTTVRRNIYFLPLMMITHLHGRPVLYSMRYRRGAIVLSRRLNLAAPP